MKSFKQYFTETFEAHYQDIINSPEFKEFFGNSDVVDDGGMPLTVYHGSNHPVEGDFWAANTHHQHPSTYVSWWTPDIEYANEYTKKWGNNKRNISPAFIRIENMLDMGEIWERFTKRQIQKRFKVKGIPAKYNLASDPLDRSGSGEGIELKMPVYNWFDGIPKLWKQIHDRGYDGVTATENGHRSYGVFNSDQIRSIYSFKGSI